MSGAGGRIGTSKGAGHLEGARRVGSALGAVVLLCAAVAGHAAGSSAGAKRARSAGRTVLAPARKAPASPARNAVSTASAPRPVSFRYDVLPILSRAGCNQGSCHGNAAGRGGLKLSLKGEDPEADYEVLARHGGARRLNRADPGRSLLLLKGTAAAPHGGGRRLAENSEEFRTLARWIAEGAASDPPDAPRLVRLEVRPAERILVLPARRAPVGCNLAVIAHFSDGSRRDVTRRAVYNAGDPTVRVDADGRVQFDGPGDVAVLVRYAEGMETARLTCVPAPAGGNAKSAPGRGRTPAEAWPAPANWIDALVFRRLRLLGLRPSPVAEDAVFLRRAYLDALGTLPTPEETRAFLADRRPDKRARLVDALLQRPEFAEFWTMRWSDILRVEERTLDPKGAAAYRAWIRAAIAEGMPLDRFARELLTAEGSTYANPPANYYRRTRTPEELAETTAQIFMGTRLLCAKCHNHPFERWKQEDYYALAAFFARVDRKIENLTRKDRFDLHELNGEEFIRVAAQGEVEHPRTHRPMPPGLPAWLPPLATIAPGASGGAGREPGAPEDRRALFAAWLTRPDNPFFARAMANRIWFYLTGRGIVDPVDDLRESNPPSHPELLDALARELVRSGYDLRHMVRLVMNSRTYQLSAEPNATNAADERFFSRAIPQRLPAEVLLDAISQVTEAPETLPENAAGPVGRRAISLIPVNKQRHPFLALFGQPARESACECERTNETTLGQSFALISGTAIDAKLKRPENRIGRLMAAGRSDAQILEELYLAALCREPTPGERAALGRYLAARPNRRAALEDILWALLNSKEFLLRR